jgi:hypothetical protein
LERNRRSLRRHQMTTLLFQFALRESQLTAGIFQPRTAKNIFELVWHLISEI